MLQPKRRWLLALLVGLYLYFLLPATAVLFYELYHLTNVDALYWGYSAFKAAGYYLGIWPYRLMACVGAGLVIVCLPPYSGRRKANEPA